MRRNIGIITFYFAHNYGASLQAYALKHYLNKQQANVSFVQFAPQKLRNAYTINPFDDLTSLRSTKRMLGRIIRYPIRINQYKKFELFIRKKLSCESKNDMRTLDTFYDILITGSDQVWNDDITGDYDEYFLSFSKNTKKISYAASFGKQNVSLSIQKKINKYLPKYDAISVREGSGINIINDIIDSKVTRVVDPVFLLSKLDWEDEIENSKLIEGDFILYYSLEKNYKLYSRSVQLSKELNIPIYGIHPLCLNSGSDIKILKNVGPLEFLWLTKNAKIICSNSFHAVAFSIIFEKQLLHIPHKTLGGRSKDLLALLGIYEEDLEAVLDNSNIDRSILNNLINDSKKFISQNIL